MSIYIFFYVHTWEIDRYDAKNDCFIYKKWTLKIKWIICLLLVSIIPVAGLLLSGMFCIYYLTEDLPINTIKLDGGLVTMIRNGSKWFYKKFFGWSDKEI